MVRVTTLLQLLFHIFLASFFQRSCLNTPSKNHFICDSLHDSTRKIHRLGPPNSSADLEHNIRIVIELSSRVKLRKTLQLSGERLPLKALQDFLRALLPWVEEAFRSYIISPATADSVFDRIWCPTDPEGGAVCFSLPLLHLIDAMASHPSLCREMMFCLSFRDACIECWLITLPHSSFRDPFLHLILHLSEIPEANVEEAVRSIASSIPTSVLNAIITEFPASMRPSDQDDPGYIAHLSSCIGSLFAVTRAAPNNSVFNAPVSLRWLGAILKTLVRQVDCRAVKEVIIWTLGCLEHVLPFSHYTVIGNLVESGLLKDVMTAAAKMTRTDVATILVGNFYRALEGIFSSLQAVIVYLPVFRPLQRTFRSGRSTSVDIEYEMKGDAGTALVLARPRENGNTVVNAVSQSTARDNARRKTGLWDIGDQMSPKEVHTKDFMFQESIIAVKIHWFQNEVDNERNIFVKESNGQYSEDDSILVFDYRCGFSTTVQFQWKGAKEEDWNSIDSYKVEIMAMGVGEEYLWRTTYPKVAD
ncbi:hypothetical protein EDD18DRAFT_1104563 [Armillaria luteobubalina]|uniref:Uncharacterized protein n=1 Tax=Armillaria luteobubalina TaxID=153913 RepID=A0AA39Q847_9AGAR|nr:hypothetical protein EDD18DRAFT_1104563 [Armillaria luteobubalina]